MPSELEPQGTCAKISCASGNLCHREVVPAGSCASSPPAASWPHKARPGLNYFCGLGNHDGFTNPALVVDLSGEVAGEHFSQHLAGVALV